MKLLSRNKGIEDNY